MTAARFPLALHTWTLDTTPLEGALAAARAGGFDAVELRRTDFDRCFERGLSNGAVLELIRAAGMPVSTLGVEYGWLFARGDESRRLYAVFRELLRQCGGARLHDDDERARAGRRTALRGGRQPARRVRHRRRARAPIGHRVQLAARRHQPRRRAARADRQGRPVELRPAARRLPPPPQRIARPRLRRGAGGQDLRLPI